MQNKSKENTIQATGKFQANKFRMQNQVSKSGHYSSYLFLGRAIKILKSICIYVFTPFFSLQIDLSFFSSLELLLTGRSSFPRS